jgi:hypothetical protein
MKKIFFLLLSSVLVISSWAQVKSGDADLDKRLAEYMKYNDELNFEKIMDYMHPKLFKIAPRDAIVASMKAAFESEDMKLTMDDLGVTGVGPSFKSAGSEYRKVEYKMTMTIGFTDTTVYEPEFIEQMTAIYTESFAGKKVTFDKKAKAFVIVGTDILYAIKDAGKPWLFIGYKNDPELLKQLFSKEVIDHFKMLD